MRSRCILDGGCKGELWIPGKQVPKTDKFLRIFGDAVKALWYRDIQLSSSYSKLRLCTKKSAETFKAKGRSIEAALAL